MNISSLRFKLTVWYLVLLGLIVGASGTFLFQVLKEKRIAEFDRNLREQARALASKWEHTEGLSWEQAIAQTGEESLPPYIRLERLSFVDSRSGTRRPASSIRSANVPDGAFEFQKEAYDRGFRSMGGIPAFLTVRDPLLEASPIRVVMMPVSRDEALQYGVSLGAWRDELRSLGFLLLVSGGVILALALAGGSFIIRKALGPVRDVVRAARKISADDLSLRLPSRRQKDEIGELVDTFNGMIARLETSVNDIVRFSGDVSHELRTPLTAIRSEIEVLLRKERTPAEYVDALRSALEETGRLEKIIGDLLFLSRLDTVDGTAGEDEVRLEDIISSVVDRASGPARAKGLRLACKIVESVAVHGRAELLERLAANLVENAIRYTPSGGSIEATVEREESGAGRITVADTGIGIPARAIPGVFDRFTVVDASRSKETGGAGLGLSIVKRVADIHGASVDIESREGEGSRFTVRFPAP